MGAIAQATLFGELAVLVYTINQQSIILQEKIDTVNTAMQNLNLPEDLQSEVIVFIKKNQFSQNYQQELNQFMQLIPSSFEHKIINTIFHQIFFNEEQKGLGKSFIKDQIEREDEFQLKEKSASKRSEASKSSQFSSLNGSDEENGRIQEELDNHKKNKLK